MITILLITLTAAAHKPSFGLHPTVNSAFHIDDTDISMVLYQDITCDAEQVWIHFDGEAESELYFQLGVPRLSRLMDYRPAVALLAPGLPELEEAVPFDLPDGVGGLLFNSDSDYTEFYEPFTQTESLVWVEETITLPQTGNAWLVAFHPEHQTGKLWLAVGTVEDFSDVGIDDWGTWTTSLAEFHETDGERDTDESICLEESSADVVETSCNHLASAAPLYLAILLMPLTLTRRRDPKELAFSGVK